MKLCQFYLSAALREQDLTRRIPTQARLGLLVQNKIVDITEEAAKSHNLNDPQIAGILTAAVAMNPQFAALRDRLRNMPPGDGHSPEKVFFAPCVLRPSQ